MNQKGATQGGSGWSTIESAPKDGSWFLASAPQYETAFKARWVDAGFESEEQMWSMEAHHCWTGYEPTHWQPLPTPPAPEAHQPSPTDILERHRKATEARVIGIDWPALAADMAKEIERLRAENADLQKVVEDYREHAAVYITQNEKLRERIESLDPH